MSARDGASVRHPAVSGMFYSSDPGALAADVSRMLDAAETVPVPGRLVALVVPHAGIMYSGPVAAYAYKHVPRASYPRAVLVGVSHRHRIGTVSVYPEGRWPVPNGEFPVDAEFVSEFQSRLPVEAEGPGPHREEHCLEVQLPFLAETLGQVPIVPMLLGPPLPDLCTQLGKSLAETIRADHAAILLASTDLSHYHDQQRAEQLDHAAIDAVLTISAETLSRQARDGACELCGLAAVMTVMNAAAELGANRATLLRYATSGDITGDFDQVVGYAAIAFSRKD